MSFAQKLRTGILLMSTLAIVPASQAGPPRFSKIDYPGATKTFVYGINPAGEIVGAYDDATGEHGFLLRNGAFTSFDYPGASWTDAYGINPQGDIVGQYGLADSTTHGFLLSQGDFYPIEVPGPHDAGLPNSMPYKIGPDGTIVGCYHQSNSKGGAVAGTMHGFAMNADGVIFDPDANSMNLGVSPEGDVVGYMSVPTDPRSYLLSQGALTWFTKPGSVVTRATDINPSGVIVGFYKDATAQYHGFVLRDGAYTNVDANFPGASGTRLYGINPQGDMVGFYQDSSGWHGFLYSRRDAD
jgi:uncharacterized membrane protein